MAECFLLKQSGKTEKEKSKPYGIAQSNLPISKTIIITTKEEDENIG